MKKHNIILKTLLITLLFLLGNITVNAATANVTVSSSTSRVVIGNTFNVTIKISSSTRLGTWEFTPSYDKTKFKLISGETSVVGWSDEGIKSKSFNYKFKAISTGTGTIDVKSVGIIAYTSEKKMSIHKSNKTIKVITQKELEDSYSKNNNLKSLTVKGLKLSPKFNSSTTKYTVEASANTTSVTIKASAEDSKSKVKGTGKKNVSEGENKLNVVVTAQNGTIKTYTIIVNVTDPNPIEVIIDNEKYTVVKISSSIDLIDGFTKSTTKINNINIPCLYNENTKMTLVGLKNTEGDISLFRYLEDDTYEEYNEINLESLRLLPLKIEDKFYKQMKKQHYKKSNITIDNVEFESLKRDNSDYSIIYAEDLENGGADYYLYDERTRSAIRYFETDAIIEDNDTKYKNQILGYKKMILLLGAETISIIIILICILIKRLIKNKKRRDRIKAKIEEERKKKELEKKKKKTEVKEEKKETKTNKKKEALKDDKDKENKKDRKNN